MRHAGEETLRSQLQNLGVPALPLLRFRADQAEDLACAGSGICDTDAEGGGMGGSL